jgi:hypothetical protein
MEGLVQCLQEKAALLGRILEETRRQAGLIEDCDLEGLRGSIRARQADMDAVDAIDGRMKDKLTKADTGNAAELLLGIGSLLREIRGEDARNLKSADALAKKYMAGIKEANAGKSMLAYSAPPPQRCRYINKKG